MIDLEWLCGRLADQRKSGIPRVAAIHSGADPSVDADPLRNDDLTGHCA